MDMIDVHKDALAKSIVAFGEFLHYYKPDKKLVYAFVEGREDPSFYRGVIDSVLPGEWSCKFFRPGNKKKVLEVYSYMDWHRFPRQAICFFVDRDLSAFLNDPVVTGSNLYITDNYSVENDMACTVMFRRMLEEVCGVTGLRAEDDEVLGKQFDENLAFFKEGMVSVMAQIIIQRRAEGANIIARLDKVKPRRFFTYSNGKMDFAMSYSQAYDRAKAAAEAMEIVPAPQTDVESVEAEFRAREGPDRFIRGKYMVQFLTDCTNEIRNAIPSIIPRITTVPGSNGVVAPGTAMVVLGPRCRCPESLKNFLDDNYATYIRSRAAA